MSHKHLRGAGALVLLGVASSAAITANVAPPARRAPQAGPSGTAVLSPVTDAMLAKPSADDWLMWRGTLNSWGYSPLTQITTGNVSQLQLVWTRGLEAGSQEGTPLVHDGVLF